MPNNSDTTRHDGPVTTRGEYDARRARILRLRRLVRHLARQHTQSAHHATRLIDAAAHYRRANYLDGRDALLTELLAQDARARRRITAQ